MSDIIIIKPHEAAIVLNRVVAQIIRGSKITDYDVRYLAFLATNVVDVDEKINHLKGLHSDAVNKLQQNGLM